MGGGTCAGLAADVALFADLVVLVKLVVLIELVEAVWTALHTQLGAVQLQ